MVSDVLLLSYLDKIGLSLTDEAGQASAYLYSEVKLAPLSQSTTTRSTGNISVGEKKVGHSNTRGTVSLWRRHKQHNRTERRLVEYYMYSELVWPVDRWENKGMHIYPTHAQKCRGGGGTVL